ncbi:MAG: DUF4129 domain-containing protein [Planctomycetaceae bacterium]|nr:DUF4129 domain-containing protein [Planctomycetaceae bacterium]
MTPAHPSHSMLPPGWFAALIVLAAVCTSQSALAQQWESVSDTDIDSIGDQVLQSDDFRSVRRRVLEQIPGQEIAESEGGFLNRMLKKAGELLSGAVRSIGDFFDNLWSKMTSGSRRQRITRTSSGNSSTSSGSGLDLSFGGSLGRGMVIFIIALVIAFLIAMAVAAFRRSERRQVARAVRGVGIDDLDEQDGPPGEQAALTYEHRALQLAAEGNYRKAIRELLLGSMSWIERSGAIRFRQGLTNRDYVRAVWRQRPVRDAFGRIALNFERVYFGRRTATEEMFQQTLVSFQGAFRETEANTAV